MDNQEFLKSFPESFWMASTNATDYPSLDQDISVDIAIIGGGITGISCAYSLKDEGFKIAILEADHIAQGASGHTTAKVTSQHGLIYNKTKLQLGEELAKQYAEANEHAIQRIKSIIDTHHIDCDYKTESAFIYTQQDNYVQKIYNEIATASDLGIKASFVDNIPFPIDIKAAVRFDDQGQFHPRKYLLALAKEITNSNCTIYEKTRIVGIDESNKYTLTTERGNKITADKVIIASHYPFYNKQAMYFARLYCERSYALAVKAKEKYPGGMYLSAEDPKRSLRLINSPNGDLIMVGGETHKTGQSKDTFKHYEAIMNFANGIFTVEDIPYKWSAQDCITVDDIPYVGKYIANSPNLYVATGFRKWGMTNSMAAAIIIKDLIVVGKSPWQDVYNPSRKTIIASAKNFVVENFNVAEELLGGKLSPLPEDIFLEPDEGKLVKINDERIGVYRDEHCKLHKVNTTCTHMGCELNWNSAERTWDCPCHGSRFSHKGDIVEGPAVKPLSFDNNVNTIGKLLNEDF
ncbi:FAD-dependent oxidoreductase [Clostridium cellulovorans]|uniref:FAD dependent oxidoreductase n=1 Tax=Clostridium cellulovorans (strain ATCC 35296 / DSM 3052 / OCM 3 / 743B) TaxID=573061 RepID=D9SMT4_CLOC7|nr:FAD-dependent oxidoreductase [Clostridium cellulovorans]ADL49869.1 FAD dependent oxidoreductase [Clostridium cellulovorans 743B]